MPQTPFKGIFCDNCKVEIEVVWEFFQIFLIFTKKTAMKTFKSCFPKEKFNIKLKKKKYIRPENSSQ